jgi:hypothetical protein
MASFGTSCFLVIVFIDFWNMWKEISSLDSFKCFQISGAGTWDILCVKTDMFGKVFIWNVLILCESLVIRKFKLCAMRLRTVEALGLQGRATALFAARWNWLLIRIVRGTVSNSKATFDRCNNPKVLMSYFLRQTRKHFFISAIHW